MKKHFYSFLLVFLPMMAMGQTNGLVIAEADFATASEFTGWYQFGDSQTDGKVELGVEGLEITVGVQTGQLWQPQIMVIGNDNFDLKEGGNYKVVVTAKFPTSGTLQINMGSWSANDEDQFYVNATGSFQEVECEFINWTVTADGAHLMFQCGDFKGMTILKNIKVIEYIPSDYVIWTIAGDEKLLGENWNATSIYNYMRTFDGVNYTLTKKDIMLSKGTYHFKVYNNTTNESYPNSNASLVIEEDAVYSVKFTFNSNTKSVSTTATKTGGIFYNFITKGKVAEVKQISTNAKGNIIIPEKVTHEGEDYIVNRILNNAFSDCTGITSITIPNTVTSIGQYAFSGCTRLASVTLPSNINSIGDYVFSNCNGLTSFTIPSSVTSIGVGAFSGCNNLKAITIPTNISSIGGYAFSGCTKLTSVTIPNSVTSIGDYVFSNCNGLTSFTIPSSVTSIGSSAFSGCTSLTSITIPNSVTSIGAYVFSGCSGLASVTIPNTVTSIGGYAFANCKGLKSITIPNSVTSIDWYAFSGCSGLTSITIPNNVNYLGDCSFSNCSSLTSIIIGSNVGWIHDLAFSSCAELKDVYCYSNKVLGNNNGDHDNTSSNAFQGSYIEYATLHIPITFIDAFRSEQPWKDFGSIVSLDGEDIPEIKKCETPEIRYKDGKLDFTCETEGVEFVSEVIVEDAKKYYNASVTLSQTYKISVYATKAGYENSDVTTREIVIENGQASLFGDLNKDGKVNVADHVKLSDIIMNK